jgi:hypothetical protein
MPKPRPAYISVRNGDLAFLDRKSGKQHSTQYSNEEKRQFYSGLLYLAVQRGNKPGSAAYRFKDKFGHFPAEKLHTVIPTRPTPEVEA